MSHHTSEQVEHDRVNLFRLVRRLEKTVASSQWQESVSPLAKSPWLKTQAILQNVKHARKLLESVELQSSTSSRNFQDIRKSLDSTERTVTVYQQYVTPKHTRPEPILPNIPLPSPKPQTPPPDTIKEKLGSPSLSPDPNTSISAQDLLLSPSESADVSGIDLLNPSVPSISFPVPPPSASAPTVAKVKGTPAFFQNSTAIHEELSEQLAQMATQLKRNAVHFAGSLEKDKAVVLEAQEKLERNFDVMSNQRVRLRDHRTKSWGTTWITVLSILVAVIGFILTFFVIRFT